MALLDQQKKGVGFNQLSVVVLAERDDVGRELLQVLLRVGRERPLRPARPQQSINQTTTVGACRVMMAELRGYQEPS